MAIFRAAALVFTAVLTAGCAAGAEPAPLLPSPVAIGTVRGDTIPVVPAPCRLPSPAGTVSLWHPTDPPIRVGRRMLPATGRSCVVRPDSLPGDARLDDGSGDEPQT